MCGLSPLKCGKSGELISHCLLSISLPSASYTPRVGCPSGNGCSTAPDPLITCQCWIPPKSTSNALHPPCQISPSLRKVSDCTWYCRSCSSWRLLDSEATCPTCCACFTANGLCECGCTSEFEPHAWLAAPGMHLGILNTNVLQVSSLHQDAGGQECG